MAELTYPEFRTGKDIDARFAPNVGTISCEFKHLVRSFGRPTFSVDNNDSFEGTEQCSWHIQFKNGYTAIVAESREFGNTEDSYERSTSWKVNTRFSEAYEWIKQIIRDSNPNG